MFEGVLVAVVLLALFVLPLILASVAISRSRRIEGEMNALRESLDSLRERLYELKKEAKVAPAPAPPPGAPPAVAVVTASPLPQKKEDEQPTPVTRPAAVELPPLPPLPPEPPPRVSEVSPLSTALSAGLASAVPPPAPLEPSVPLASFSQEPKTPRFGRSSIDWEGFVGVRLFSWIAGIFLAIGAIFFLRYSIDRGWLSAPVRMALGLLVGTGLLVVCEWKAARRYAVTANALDGAGIAILFSTVFAANALWHLVGLAPAFLLMTLVTAVAVALSIRRNSVFIALLGLIGGFATPALLSTGEDRPFGLFGYLLLLNAGLAWVAYRKRWVYLSVLSLAFTTFYQWGWVAKFLTEAKLGLAVGIFLVFPVLSVLALFLLPRSSEERPHTLFGRTAAASATLPLLFALFVAAMPAYGPHWALLFGFLFLVDAGLASLAALRGPEELHVLGAGATLAVFGIWLVVSRQQAPLGGILAFLSLFVLSYLFAGKGAARLRRPYTAAGSSAVYAGPLLLFVVPILVALDPAARAPKPVFGFLLALTVVVAAASSVQRRPFLHLAAAPFVLGAQALWLAQHLVPENLLTGLAVHCVFGLFYIAAPAVAPRLLEGGKYRALILSLAASGPMLLLGVAAQPTLSTPPWPFLGVLGLLTVAASVLALHLDESTLLSGALAVAQIVLLVFEARVQKAPWPQVAVVASVAVALWGIALFALSRRKMFALSALIGLFFAQLVVLVATIGAGIPPIAILLPAHLILLAAILSIAWATGRHVVAVLAAASCALADFAFQAGHAEAGRYLEDLLFGGLLFAVFLIYPLLLGRRAKKEREPYLAAVLSSAAFFFFARRSFLDAGWENIIGLLPVCEAILLAALLLRLLRLGIPPAEDVARLSLVAGAILAFVTVAVPLQLDKEWITIGWALLAAALAWLYSRVSHPGLLAVAAGLFVAAFVRLAFNPAVMTYHARTPTPIWNWYLYTYLVPAAAFFLAARLLVGAPWSSPSPILPLLSGLRRLLPVGGTVLLFLLLNIEIADYFSTGSAPTFRFLSATLAEGLSYTLGWAVFAIALLIAGILAVSRASRVAAVLLLLVTVFKCFLFDLSRLGGLYRVASFVGLAASLAAVALLLQRFVLSGRKETA